MSFYYYFQRNPLAKYYHSMVLRVICKYWIVFPILTISALNIWRFTKDPQEFKRRSHTKLMFCSVFVFLTLAPSLYPLHHKHKGRSWKQEVNQSKKHLKERNNSFIQVVSSQCLLKTYSGLDSVLGIGDIALIKYKFANLEKLPLWGVLYFLPLSWQGKEED